jgi:hypothetical protein
MINDDKVFLSMAGEFRVCSELLRRGLFSTVTYGNQKGIDIYAINGNRSSRIEVKSSYSNRIVTSFFQKYKESKSAVHPDFWVLCKLTANENDADRFFVFSHNEIKKIQSKRNNGGKNIAWKLAAENAKKGVDNLQLNQLSKIENYENRWDKILKYLFDK